MAGRADASGATVLPSRRHGSISHRRLTRVDAHAALEIGCLGHRVRGETALAGDRRSDGVPGAPERDKERVTLRIDLIAVMLVERLAQDSPMLVERVPIQLAT